MNWDRLPPLSHDPIGTAALLQEFDLLGIEEGYLRAAIEFFHDAAEPDYVTGKIFQRGIAASKCLTIIWCDDGGKAFPEIRIEIEKNAPVMRGNIYDAAFDHLKAAERRGE